MLRRRLITALVVPHLDYFTLVYLDASIELRTRLQRLGNSYVRYIYGVGIREHVTPYSRSLGWLQMDARRMYFAAKLRYNIHRLGKPTYLADLFSRYRPRVPSRGEQKDWSIPVARTNFGLSSIQIECTHFWNSLPSSVHDLPSIPAFRTAVYKYLLDLDA